MKHFATQPQSRDFGFLYLPDAEGNLVERFGKVEVSKGTQRADSIDVSILVAGTSGKQTAILTHRFAIAEWLQCLRENTPLNLGQGHFRRQWRGSQEEGETQKTPENPLLGQIKPAELYVQFLESVQAQLPKKLSIVTPPTNNDGGFWPQTQADPLYQWVLVNERGISIYECPASQFGKPLEPVLRVPLDHYHAGLAFTRRDGRVVMKQELTDLIRSAGLEPPTAPVVTEDIEPPSDLRPVVVDGDILWAHIDEKTGLLQVYTSAPEEIGKVEGKTPLLSVTTQQFLTNGYFTLATGQDISKDFLRTLIDARDLGENWSKRLTEYVQKQDAEGRYAVSYVPHSRAVSISHGDFSAYTDEHAPEWQAVRVDGAKMHNRSFSRMSLTVTGYVITDQERRDANEAQTNPARKPEFLIFDLQSVVEAIASGAAHVTDSEKKHQLPVSQLQTLLKEVDLQLPSPEQVKNLNEKTIGHYAKDIGLLIGQFIREQFGDDIEVSCQVVPESLGQQQQTFIFTMTRDGQPLPNEECDRIHTKLHEQGLPTVYQLDGQSSAKAGQIFIQSDAIELNRKLTAAKTAWVRDRKSEPEAEELEVRQIERSAREKGVLQRLFNMQTISGTLVALVGAVVAFMSGGRKAEGGQPAEEPNRLGQIGGGLLALAGLGYAGASIVHSSWQEDNVFEAVPPPPKR